MRAALVACILVYQAYRSAARFADEIGSVNNAFRVTCLEECINAKREK
jgi:hypothetical protein